MKTIVAHIGPDCDAITSIWLVKMFFPGWEEASYAFVPAGTTLGKLPPDDNPEIYMSIRVLGNLTIIKPMPIPVPR